MTTTLADVTAHRLVPVLVLDDVHRAAELGQALRSGGLPVAEVTFRTPAAAACLRALAEDREMLVGAGTVITPDQVDLAADSGARFVVSPGLDPRVVERAAELGLPALPGVATATEITMALGLGLDTVKFFPAGTSGGPAAIKALAAPFREVRFVPTGGVSADYLADYFALPCVPAVAWYVENGALQPGDEPGLGVGLDEDLLTSEAYQVAYLPVARRLDGTVTDW